MLLHVEYITFPDAQTFIKKMTNYGIGREGKRTGKNVYKDFNLSKNKDVCESLTQLHSFQPRWETDLQDAVPESFSTSWEAMRTLIYSHCS